MLFSMGPVLHRQQGWAKGRKTQREAHSGLAGFFCPEGCAVGMMILKVM